ncbi:phage virion morphogenesis protein [Methylogaea oryzae]|uniref:Virion morphogenesis protein n=1 Tax=Methylogaea oryzae TaxID=1295382 RepID=A0A8D5AJR8_9GAMM|nr:phage virion morphogenesis protein [Methylogaea oryzae]BBL70336.1 virion morphogenesis protein [Methylogaea oryzae]
MISIEIDNRQVQEALRELERRATNMAPALKQIGEALADSTKRRFETTTAPDGTPWEANRPTTLARKKGTRPLTGETGNLMDTIDWQLIGDDAVEIGSPMEYAATQQFGAKMGEFGRYSQIGRVRKHGLGTFQGSAGTQKGFPIPWGNIPARPFLGISDADEREVLEIVQTYLSTPAA